MMRHLPDPPANRGAVLRRQLAPVARLAQKHHERILDLVPRTGAAVSFHVFQRNPNGRRQPFLEKLESGVGHPTMITGAPSNIDAHGTIRLAVARRSVRELT